MFQCKFPERETELKGVLWHGMGRNKVAEQMIRVSLVLTACYIYYAYLLNDNRAVAGTHASALHKALFSVPPIGHAPPTKNHGFVALESTTCRVALYTGSEELTKPRYGKLSNDGTFASSMCIALPNPSVS